MQISYEVVTRQPVARFYYKGHHSHPIRRTVLIIQSTPQYIRGYELREGSVTRALRNAPVKTYRRSRIATLENLGPAKHREKGPPITTLKRRPLLDLVLEGA